MLQKNWNELIKPEKVKISKIFEQDYLCVSELTVEPLEKGFGHTLGNALRRIMLSSIGGFAVKAIKISGVSHDYSCINGVLEDTIQIIANIKKLVFQGSTANEVHASVEFDKEGVILGSDIDLSGTGLKVVNPKQVIMTLNSSVKGRIDFIIGFGKGYSVAEINSIDLPVDYIGIDSIYSPVKLVSYQVDNSRFGQVMDYDKLIMKITTNSAIDPEMAFAISSKILQDQLSVFVSFDEEKKEEVVAVKEESNSDENPLLFRLADELDLSARAANCLRKEKIYYIGDLVSKSEIQLLGLSNFGRKSLEEIYKKLQVFSKKNNSNSALALGMKINWPPKNLDSVAKKNSNLLD